MRRTATEILHDLETRVSNLEKKARVTERDVIDAMNKFKSLYLAGFLNKATYEKHWDRLQDQLADFRLEEDLDDPSVPKVPLNTQGRTAMRRTASEILHDLESRVARLERRAGGKYPKLLKALQAWIPSFTERHLTGSLEDITSRGVKVKHEQIESDDRFGYDYGSISGVHGDVSCEIGSQVAGELEFTWVPELPILDNRDRGALVDLSKAMGELLDYVEAEAGWSDAVGERVYGSGFKGSLKLLGVRVVNNTKLVVKVMADVEADVFEDIDCRG